MYSHWSGSIADEFTCILLKRNYRPLLMADLSNIFRVRQVRVPRTREPFINTPLISLGVWADGLERFWSSSWNSVGGSTGVLLDASGGCREYPLSVRSGGYYSVAQESERVLWLCGNLSFVLRLDLDSGKLEEFDTGVTPVMIFYGMIFDPATRKLLASGFPAATQKTTAFSFDVDLRRVVAVHEDFARHHASRDYFSNGDGTWSIVMHLPGESIVRWDPVAETLTERVLLESKDTLAEGGSLRVARDANGRVYFPSSGWYNPRTRRFQRPTKPPQRDGTWFGCVGSEIIGEVGDGRVGAWNLETGAVRLICAVEDSSAYSFAVGADGRQLFSLNIYGFFKRFDLATGGLELSRDLGIRGVCHTDCVCPAGKDHLIGTPFITQRFWLADLRTGVAEDCGRAAPGRGEILRTWEVGGKVYMAAYTGAELMYLDPAKAIRFPENPQVVCKPPRAVRPVASERKGAVLYYSCTRPYGEVGSVVTRFDTRSGVALFAGDPLPDRQIRSLFYDRASEGLVVGAAIHADQLSRPAVAEGAMFGLLDERTLAVRATCCEDGFSVGHLVGPLRRGEYLAAVFRDDNSFHWKLLKMKDFSLVDWDAPDPDLAPVRLVYSGFEGRFFRCVAGQLELLDLRDGLRRTVVWRFPKRDGLPKCTLHPSGIYLTFHHKVVALEGNVKELI